MHQFSGQEESCDAHQLEAVGSYRRARQEAVHYVHRQTAALKGQTEVSVDGDEPADECAPGLRC